MDRHGRIGDCVVFTALGWRSGTRLCVRQAGRLIALTEDAQGTVSVTAGGWVHLPVVVQRRHGLRAGDRVLLRADPANGTLTVHPSAVLAAMISAHLDPVSGGDPR